MRDRYLEVTFRRGRPLAAYLYLRRRPGVRSARTRPVAPGVRADYAADGVLIGIELTAPDRITADVLGCIDEVLGAAGQEPLMRQDIAPLAAAA